MLTVLWSVATIKKVVNVNSRGMQLEWKQMESGFATWCVGGGDLGSNLPRREFDLLF